MNRRGFIRSAAGVLIAAGAGELLLPERTIFALDRTMIPNQAQVFANAVDSNIRNLLWEAYLRESKRLEEAIIYGRIAPDDARAVYFVYSKILERGVG